MHDLRPENPAERWVYRSLIYTWPIYAVGGLYVLGPVLGWTLGGLALTALYLGPAMRADLRPNAVPPMVWIWVIGMLLMLPILWIGHVNWGFGTKTIIRSTIGWAKGWALLALFPLAGAILPILGHDPETLIAYGRSSGITMCGLQAAALAISDEAPPDYGNNDFEHLLAHHPIGR